jgi:hypothetical protein
MRDLGGLMKNEKEFHAWYHLLSQVKDPLVTAALLQSEHIAASQAESLAVAFLNTYEQNQPAGWYALCVIAASRKVSCRVLDRAFVIGGWGTYLALA